jgi:hypothetical protein
MMPNANNCIPEKKNNATIKVGMPGGANCLK